MGYAYYYLDQEGRALRYFEKALELHPGDDPKLNTQQAVSYTHLDVYKRQGTPRWRRSTATR